MLQEDRFLKIVEYLEHTPVATFAELAALADASVGTIRRDLAALEENGMLTVVRGGATAHKDDLTKQAFDMRGIEHKQEKKELAELLHNLVVDGQAIALNSGTTNLEAAHYLVEHYHRLTVITNNLRILDVLKKGRNFTLIIPGGILNAEEYSIYGRDCEREILSYNLDLALLAVNAISDTKGITDFRANEVGIIRSFIRAASKTAVLADHSKFDRIAYRNVCGIQDIDYIVSDHGLSSDQITRYKNKGVQIFTPKTGDCNDPR